MSKNLTVIAGSVFLLFINISACIRSGDNSSTNRMQTMAPSSGMQHDQMDKITKNIRSDVKKAIAVLFPAPNGNVKGIVTFTTTSDGKVKVVADVEGLTPGKHGFHIHEYGDCSSNDFNSAGPHYTIDKEAHGAPTSDKRHTGDMGNITAASNGKAHIEWTDPYMKLTGANSIIGRAVVVHGGEDDLKSQPAGNSGPRIACGVIGVMK